MASSSSNLKKGGSGMYHDERSFNCDVYGELLGIEAESLEGCELKLQPDTTMNGVLVRILDYKKKLVMSGFIWRGGDEVLFGPPCVEDPLRRYPSLDGKQILQMHVRKKNGAIIGELTISLGDADCKRFQEEIDEFVKQGWMSSMIDMEREMHRRVDEKNLATVTKIPMSHSH